MARQNFLHYCLVGCHIPNVENLLSYDSGSQPGCLEIVSGVPPVVTFIYIYIIFLHLGVPLTKNVARQQRLMLLYDIISYLETIAQATSNFITTQ